MQDPGAILELVAVMDRLRSPGGCPWDARQTHRSLVEYLVEECYEVIEAIESEDRAALREELGDLLLQVVFHARIAAEDPDDPWTIDDVAAGIVAKLIRRHPHVFPNDASSDAAGREALSADQVEQRWHELKAQEKGRASVTEGIPTALPSLLLAAKLLSRSTGLAVPTPTLPGDVGEGAAAALAGIEDEETLGDLLLVLVMGARGRGLDAEAALRGAARRYADAIRETEAGEAEAREAEAGATSAGGA